jgi:hypothetical protein
MIIKNDREDAVVFIDDISDITELETSEWKEKDRKGLKGKNKKSYELVIYLKSNRYGGNYLVFDDEEKRDEVYKQLLEARSALDPDSQK